MHILSLHGYGSAEQLVSPSLGLALELLRLSLGLASELVGFPLGLTSDLVGLALCFALGFGDGLLDGLGGLFWGKVSSCGGWEWRVEVEIDGREEREGSEGRKRAMHGLVGRIPLWFLRLEGVFRGVYHLLRWVIGGGGMEMCMYGQANKLSDEVQKRVYIPPFSMPLTAAPEIV